MLRPDVAKPRQGWSPAPPRHIRCAVRAALLTVTRGAAALVLGLLFIVNCTLAEAPAQARSVAPASVSHEAGGGLVPLQPTAAEVHRPTANAGGHGIAPWIPALDRARPANARAGYEAPPFLGTRPKGKGSRAPPFF